MMINYCLKQTDRGGTVHTFTIGEIEGIRRPISRFFPSMHVYIYFVDGLLIDSGPRLNRTRVVKQLKKWDIEKVAITHHHPDHSGLVPWLRQRFDIPIYLNAPTKTNFFSRSYRELTEHYPDTIHTNEFEVIPIDTPGHTEDHVSLYVPEEGLLFTGDLYVTSFPKVSLRSESIGQYISSLQKVLTLDFQTVFCAHQGMLRNGRELLEEKLNYLQWVQVQVIELYKAGYNERMITRKLFPKKAKLERLTLGAFSSAHLVRSCLREGDHHA